MEKLRTKVSPDWTVNEVVAGSPATLPVFGRYGIDSCCGGLKSLRDVAEVHRLSLDQLLADLNRAIAPRPVVLDVRSDIRAGHDPLKKILASAERLEDDQELVIVNDFEPIPLYGVLADRGFTHHTERTTDGAWKITFARRAS